MDSLYFLIPVSIVLIALAILIFLWAVRSGQFDDLEGPGHSILYEEEQADETEETKGVSKKDAWKKGALMQGVLQTAWRD